MTKDFIKGIPTNPCVNGITKEDADEIKKIPKLEQIIVPEFFDEKEATIPEVINGIDEEIEELDSSVLKSNNSNTNKELRFGTLGSVKTSVLNDSSLTIYSQNKQDKVTINKSQIILYNGNSQVIHISKDGIKSNVYSNKAGEFYGYVQTRNTYFCEMSVSVDKPWCYFIDVNNYNLYYELSIVNKSGIFKGYFIYYNRQLPVLVTIIDTLNTRIVVSKDKSNYYRDIYFRTDFTGDFIFQIDRINQFNSLVSVSSILVNPSGSHYDDITINNEVYPSIPNVQNYTFEILKP